MDGSNIYGSSLAVAETLRTKSRGLLKTSQSKTSLLKDLLPSCSTESSKSDNINPICKSCKSCFFAGDSRVNEHMNLIVMHTVWLREHNRVARLLHKLNSHWTDETLYQEARRIVVAEYQHIVYKEWLPLILGMYILINLI